MLPFGFKENIGFLTDEYNEAEYDPATGLSPERLEEEISRYPDEHPQMPLPLVTANTFAYLLDNVQLSLNPHSIFPDKMNVGISYRPFASLSFFGKLANQQIRKRTATLLPEEWEKRALAAKIGLSVPGADFWHAVPDWEAVCKLGFAGLLARAEEQRKAFADRGELDEEKEIFFDAVILSYRAAVRYLERLAAYAEIKGMAWFAAALDFLAKEPPKTFYQVCLLSFLYLNIGELGVEHYRTNGMIDRMYYPYYKADLEAGRLTEEEGDEILRFYLMKISAAMREADQPIGLGGLLPDGSDATNPLTWRILEIYRELDIHNPKIHFRWHPGISPELLDLVLELIRGGNSSIVLINDETVIRAYERIGIERKDAVNYLPIGCYEPVISGREDPRICASWFNLAKPVELVLHGEYTDAHRLLGLPKTDPEPATFDLFLYEYYRTLDAGLEYTVNSIVEQMKVQYLVDPAPFLSGSYRCCIESGLDLHNGGAEFKNTSVKCFAVGTAVDSLLAIKKIVYDDKIMTLRELSGVMKKNWVGFESLRLTVRADREKWGNHRPEADALAQEIYNFCGKRLIGRKNGLGGVFRMGADSVGNSEIYGKTMGATPDGRYAGSPTTKNFRPETGLEREGVTALISSAVGLDGSLFLDAAPIDFMIHPTAVEGERGLLALRNMVKTCFAEGGFAIQGNVVSAETLRKAQADPESYRNLQIRVCGWNEYFVNMKKNLQDDFIARAEGIEGTV